MKVFVYFNLHKKCFSVKALEGPQKGLVIRHTRFVWLENVRYKVSEAGRQRVLRERKKNVHAGVVGTLSQMPTDRGFWLAGWEGCTPLKYNPYKYSTFVTADFDQPVQYSDACYLESTGKATFITAVGRVE
jgi:hypothetical protein